MGESEERTVITTGELGEHSKPSAEGSGENSEVSAENGGSPEDITNRNKTIALALICVIVIAIIAIVSTVMPKKGYSGEKWYEQEVTLNTDIKKMEAFDGFDSVSSIADSWEYGTQYGNIASDEDNYYITDYTDNRVVTKVAKKGYAAAKLTDIPGAGINVVGEYVYFNNIYDDSDYDKGIYRVSKDGKETECILKGSYWGMRVVNDWIYYYDDAEYNLYKVNVFARRPILLVEGSVSNVNVYENTVYFKLYDENKKKNSLANISVDGGEITVIDDDFEGYSIVVKDGYYYYCLSDESINRMDMQTYEVEKIYECHNNTEFGITPDDKLYFIDVADKHSLAIYDMLDQSVVHSNINNVSGLEVCSDFVIVTYLDSELEPRVVAIDTSTKEKIDLFK